MTMGALHIDQKIARTIELQEFLGLHTLGEIVKVPAPEDDPMSDWRFRAVCSCGWFSEPVSSTPPGQASHAHRGHLAQEVIRFL